MSRVMPFTSVLIGEYSQHPKRSNPYNKTARKLQPTLSCLAETACKSLWTHLLHVSFMGGKQDTTMTAQNKVTLFWKEKSHPTGIRKLSIDTIEINSDFCVPLKLMKSSQICVLWGLVLRPITMQSLAPEPTLPPIFAVIAYFPSSFSQKTHHIVNLHYCKKKKTVSSLLGWLWFT
jgi:hypothetical protein